MTVDIKIASKYNALKQRNLLRDGTMQQVSYIRTGNFAAAFPGKFSSEWPKPTIANTIDVAARDAAEQLAPLPSINCSSPNMADDTERRSAERRTLIANNYVQGSRLPVNMYQGADWFATYGFLPFLVELDTECNTPRIYVDDPMGAYYEKDRLGNVVVYMRRHYKTCGELCAEFPLLADHIRRKDNPSTRGTMLAGSATLVDDNTKIEVVYFSDAEKTVLFLPERRNLQLTQAMNPVGKCLVVVAERLGVDGEVRGQFDDVLWVQLARSRFAALALEAATKAVQAPLALPMDVQELVLGPDALMRSNTPEKIRRVPIEMPASAFSQDQVLDRELRVGARYPESRTGNLNASVVTGKGVKALEAGFDGQLKAYQMQIADALERVIGMCFEVDEKMWPDDEKVVVGNNKGSPYELKYKPGKHIKGNYSVDVQYGLMAGLDANRSLVFGLQARSDKLISRDTLQRNLPIDINVDTENRLIGTEELRDALGQMLAGMAQSVPLMAQQGMDPLVPINQIAQVIADFQKGVPLEDAVVKAFQPPPPPETPPGEEAMPGEPPPGPPGAEATGGGGVPPGPGGPMPRGGPPPMGSTGRPDMVQLLASMTQGGQANLQAGVKRQRAI